MAGVGRGQVAAPLLDAAVPRADVLADVAAVDLRAELRAVRLRERRAAPASSTTGSASSRASRPRRARRSGRRRCRGGTRRSRCRAAGSARELDVGDERAEHDPRAVAARDQHRVLAVEADPAPRGRLAVDVLVRVDEDAVRPAEPLARAASSLLAELGVGVVPGVARRAVPLPARAPSRAASSRAPPRRRCARRARASRDGRRPPGCAIVNFISAKRPRARRSRMCALGVVVGLGARDADGVEAELFAQPSNVLARHARIVP